MGSDTADCAAALQPSIYSGQGADVFTRFRHGAESRSEIALVISPIGDLDEQSRKVRNVFGPPVASVSIGQSYTSINGRLLGKGATVHAAAELGDADGQLALRLLSCNPAPRWRSLSLSGAVLESIYGREQHPPEGTLVPILETELGEPVVAAWVSLDGVERPYIVPVETPWPSLLQWLLEQALPEFVPGAMRRARRQLGTDVFLMTRAERAARTALTELEADYIARKGELERQLNEAETAASTIREGLLYGTGKQLVDAVRSALESAGITIVDLDEKLGGTNADFRAVSSTLLWSVVLEAESSSAPPGDGDFGDVGVAQDRGVGAPVEPDGDGVVVVEDGPAGGQEPSLQGVGGGVVVAGESAAQGGADSAGEYGQDDVEVDVERH